MKTIKIVILFITFFIISACSSGGGDAPTDTPGSVVDSGIETFEITSGVSTTTAGVNQIFQITAKDDQNNVLTTYTGTINLVTTDANAEQSWTSITFTAGMAGVAHANIKFKTSGNHDIQVSEQATINAASGIMSSFVVTPASLKNFAISTLSSTVAGQAQTMTVTAIDEFSNIVTSYTGTAQISSTDGASVHAATTTFLPADSGIKTIAYQLRTAGSQTLTVQDGAVSGSSTSTNAIAVVPATPSQLVLSSIPSTAGAGVTQSSQATLRDAYNNLATNYVGNFNISSTDGSAVLPSTINFTLLGAGVGTFSYDLRTLGNQTLTISNGALSLSQTSSAILVTASTPATTHSTLSISPSSAPADNITTATVTVTIKDTYNNPVSGVAVSISSASGGVTLGQTGTTNASGVTTGTIRSSTTGVKTISISSPAGMTSITGNVTFTSPVLSAPQNLVITGRGTETVSPAITWSAPAQIGVGISHYEVAIGTSAGAQNTLAWKTIPGGSAVNSYTIQNAVDTFSLSLAFDTPYYLSLRAVDNASTTSSAVTSSSWQITWNPRAFGSSLKFWLDGADASTSTLDGSLRASQWRDKSNNAFVLNQATATDRPTQVDFLNGKGFVFDTVSKRLASTTATTFLDTDGFSAFFVQQTPTGGTWRALLSTYSNKNFMLISASSGTAYRLFNGAHTTTSLQSSSAQITGYIAAPSSNFIDRRDGTQVASVSISATTHATNNFAVGNYYFTNQNGTAASTIGEVVVLETNSSLANWEKIEGYLAHKWGLQGNLPAGHPYKSSAP